MTGCVSVHSYVQVEKMDLRAAYRSYTDNVIESGRYSQPTRQTLNLVPEARDGVDVDVALAALASSPRIEPAEAAFARSEVALAAAERLGPSQPARARVYYLVAAHEAARLLFPRGRAIRIDPFDQRYRLATGFYSLASGRYFLALMRPDSGWDGDLTEQTPLGPVSVTFDDDDSSLIAYFFQNYEIAWGVKVSGLRNRYTRDGVGVPLIGRRAPGKTFPQESYLPAGGYTAPLAVYLRFDAVDDPRPERVRIGLVDARTSRYTCFGPQRLPVAADFTAAYARQIVQDRSREAGRAALFGRRVAGSRFGISISAPWDPQKIPLIMVHGLASSSEAWRELTNDILGSEELRDRYQIVHYTYATTEPVLAAAERFRGELAAFLALVEYDPNVSPKLVVIGHSMGGLLARTLVVDSGRSIWDRVFTVDPADVRGDPAARERFERSLILRPWPSIGRVIFLGVPQHGSEAADSFLGRIGQRLISLPNDFSMLLRSIARADPGQLRADVREWFTSGRLTSVRSLSPAHPSMAGLAALPIVAGVPFHSVIGDVTRDSRGRPSDGYVTVESAHVPGATSELKLPIAHQQFDRPVALNEIYRILREHAQAVPHAAVVDGGDPCRVDAPSPAAGPGGGARE
jgi:pimeloyl-ACP methyl ester carboxylesterase